MQTDGGVCRLFGKLPEIKLQDVLVDDELIVQFYDQHLPQEVVSAVTFEQWQISDGIHLFA